MSDVDKRFIKFIVWSFVFCGLGVAFCTTILDISFSASVYAIFVIFLLVLILLPIIWWIGFLLDARKAIRWYIRLAELKYDDEYGDEPRI